VEAGIVIIEYCNTPAVGKFLQYQISPSIQINEEMGLIIQRLPSPPLKPDSHTEKKGLQT
jgi:hypothetical protein